jgi:hypothetical protein
MESILVQWLQLLRERRFRRKRITATPDWKASSLTLFFTGRVDFS